MKASAYVAHTLVLFKSQGELTSATLARALNVHIATAQDILARLRRERLTRIVRWDSDALGRPMVPVHSLGEGIDVQRTTLSRGEIMRRYRRKKKGQENGTPDAR